MQGIYFVGNLHTLAFRCELCQEFSMVISGGGGGRDEGSSTLTTRRRISAQLLSHKSMMGMLQIMIYLLCTMSSSRPS